MKINLQLFDTLLEPIFVLNKEQKIIYCNEAASILVGISTRKLSRGMIFSEAVSFSEPLEWLDRLTQIQDATPYKEVLFTSIQGASGKVQITAQPLQCGNDEKNWIVFFRDVTLEERLQQKYRGELQQKESVIEALEKARAELENYSKNLESMVQERTQQILEMHQTQSALLDSLGQGFFIFNSEGRCLDVYSKACLEIIEKSPAGMDFWNVLNFPNDKINSLKKWMKAIFQKMLPFEDLASLGPTKYEHSKGKSISLEYYSLSNPENELVGVVVVASDISSLISAQKEAASEKARAKMIVTLVQNRKTLGRSIQEGQEQVEILRNQILILDTPDFDGELSFRMLHTLKGMAGLFSHSVLFEKCHKAESRLQDFKTASTPETILQFREACQGVLSAFNTFLTEISEILGDKALSSSKTLEIPLWDFQEILNRLASLPQHTNFVSSLQEKYLFIPIRDFFTPYYDVAQEAAESLGKQIHPFRFYQGDLPILGECYSGLFSTLIHAFRNAIDHGIEFPEQRTECGKDPMGQITLSFHRKADSTGEKLLIQIQDDGKGIDPQKLRESLGQKGISTDQESDWEVLQHIFDSGVSTKTEVTHLSGRGVGMDAISFAAQELGGKAWVDSEIGKGICLSVEVPYFKEIGTPPWKATA